MTEIEQLVQRYDQTMSGDAWYGYPIWKILEGIDAPCAAAELLPGTHNIWQLVMHMEFWERVAAQRFSAPVRPEEDDAGNFPATPVVEEAEWQKSLESFRDVESVSFGRRSRCSIPACWTKTHRAGSEASATN